MATEAVLLLGLFVFLLMGAFLGERGPKAVFAQSGPRLGARIEAQLSTGRGFRHGGNTFEWKMPAGGSPAGTF